MTLKQFFALIPIVCAAFLCTSTSAAQQPPAAQTDDGPGGPRGAVAAIVNDSVISTYDVRQRIRLKLLSAEGQIPAEAMPQLQQQALRELVEEKLKLQETKEYDINASEAEVDQEIAQLAAQSNLTPGAFEQILQSQGVNIETLKQQIRAGLVWPQLVQGRYRDRVRVNEDEIDETLERMREDAGSEQYLVSEICIAVDDPAQAQQYYEGSLQLIEQMRRGVPFTVVAQQFSACTTAAVGGDVGWVRPGELEPEVDTAIRDLPPGSVSNPIPSQGAFMIMAVRDKREAVVAGEPTFTLAYATAPESVGDTAARAAFDKLVTANICSARELRIDLGKDVGYALLENMTLDSIDPRFQDAIEYLDRGDTSPVVRADDAFHAVYVCDKDEGLGLPSRAAVENRIFERQLSRLSQQYLRDIERQSTVDVKLNELLPPNG